MKSFIWIILALTLISTSIAGCEHSRARAERIGDDIDWIFLDGDPDIDK
ncbi:hypothetical protein ACFL2G_02465 [Candidatus Omnitrophota bacterium]